METILEKLGLGSLTRKFQEEKVTPDIVSKLSKVEMQILGVADRSAMMKLRVACIHHGSNLLIQRNSGYLIPEDVLDFLLESKFKIIEISQMLNVSESTIYRRMRRCNLSVSKYNDILDHELDQIVSEIATEFPKCGETMVREILRQKGVQVREIPLFSIFKFANMLFDMNLTQKKKVHYFIFTFCKCFLTRTNDILT